MILMTIDDMLDRLNKDNDSPFYEICELLGDDNFQQAIICIKEYFKCDENTAKIVCMDFKTKIYDEIYKPDDDLSPAQIAYNNAVAQELLNKPKCPTCSSQNIKKISATSKVVNTAVFGIFGTKRHKQFHCNNCGYEW